MIISRHSDEDWASIWNLNSSQSFNWRQIILQNILAILDGNILKTMQHFWVTQNVAPTDILLYNLAYILKQITD